MDKVFLNLKENNKISSYDGIKTGQKETKNYIYYYHDYFYINILSAFKQGIMYGKCGESFMSTLFSKSKQTTKFQREHQQLFPVFPLMTISELQYIRQRQWMWNQLSASDCLINRLQK